MAAAYVDLDAKFIALPMNPSLDGLDVRAAEIAVPGSVYYQALVERVTELVNNGQYLAPNTPDIQSVSVELVELTGSEPEFTAVVVACEVNNVLTMKGPDNPVRPGTPIPVGGTGDLAAYRLTQRLQRTADGWRHIGAPEATQHYWKGADACPES